MFTHFFIDRPILSAVISLLIVLAGGVAMSVAPIEQYPELAPPQVSINARYPGATAEVIASQVAAPIEAQLNGVDNLLYFQSTSSSSGNVSIAVVFKPGSNPDINQVNVQNRVSQAMSQLPQAVVQQGVTVDKQSSSIMMVLTIYSPDERYSSTYIDNYTNLYVLDELKRVPGANRATVMGLPNIAMRVWLQPDRMAQLGITVREVAQAIQSQNQTFGIGQIGGQPTLPGTQQNFVVTAQGLLTDPKEFESIIVRAAKEGTAIVRLRDIGRVELDKQDYSIASRMNGKIGTTIAIYQQPGANAVATATAVRARLEELKAQFPTGLDYRVALDTSLFTLNSIEKVVTTFFEAVVLVVLVVFVFLQSLRATVIPILAVPVSIVGTFIGMHLLGFSINMLTLFGLILAIGLVVDDAIVVVENVEANMAGKGLTALQAAKEAMTQIAGALISIVLVLVAVFLPVAFLGGVTGTLYKQFAITISISMVISGVMALTLSPALAALIIRAHHGEKKGFFRWFENGFARLTEGYVGWVARSIRAWPVALVVYGAMLVGIFFLFRLVPSSFVPEEDQGYFFVAINAPDTASLEVVAKLTSRVAADRLGRSGRSGRRFGGGLQPDRRPDPEQLGGPVRIDEAVRRAQGPVAALVRDAQAAEPAVRGHPGGLRLCDQSTVDPGSRHDRRIRVLPSEPRHRRRAGNRQGRAGLHRQGARKVGVAGRLDDLPRHDPATLRRLRPQQGRGAGRHGGRRVRDHAGILRFADRRPVLTVQPRLVGGAAGRRQLPDEPVGLRKGLRALEVRRQCAAVGLDDDALRRVAQTRHPFQRFPRRQDHRHAGARLQFGPGAGCDGGDRP